MAATEPMDGQKCVILQRNITQAYRVESCTDKKKTLKASLFILSS
jgi:hypothetical protein